jgi:crotonobetainyl-CoA:carnitine CoA-transferase CaiB-like acyl-CoA transferase
VIDTLTQVFATKTRDQWASIFSSVDACVEPVRSFSEVCQDPHWQHRKSFIQLQTPDGRTAKVPKMPGSLAGFDTREREQ